tara:strand:+ start:63 stop:377 length:315 start_codon:yes stop_codon:yes gene_type:complete
VVINNDDNQGNKTVDWEVNVGNRFLGWRSTSPNCSSTLSHAVINAFRSIAGSPASSWLAFGTFKIDVMCLSGYRNLANGIMTLSIILMSASDRPSLLADELSAY